MATPWNPLTHPRDYAIIAGQKTPGICEIVGAGDLRKWDVQRGPGLLGAYALFMGKDLAKFTIKLKLYTLEDWAGWDAFRPLISKIPRRRYGAIGGPPSVKGSGALVIIHPQLAMVGIASFVVEEIKSPEQTGEGEWTVAIAALEFRRPKVAMAKPDGAEPAAPVDPWDVKIEQYTQQLDALLEVD